MVGASYTLHGFCDASKGAYAAVIYLVVQIGSERYARFVASKTRVAPRRELSIPRLEPLSALLLARLLESVARSLSPNPTLGQSMGYTDSQVALYWIVGEGKEWKQFVHNRVTEIRELLPASCWRHCPGIENPADIPSRGLTPTELFVNQLWHCGPDWLQNPPSENLDMKEMPADCSAEEKSKGNKTCSLLVGDAVNILECKKYSSLSKLLLMFWSLCILSSKLSRIVVLLLEAQLLEPRSCLGQRECGSGSLSNSL